MTKKNWILLFMLFSVLSGRAQLSADLRVDFIQPENEQNLQAGEIYLAMIDVENHGPDSIKACDTLWLRVTFSGVPTPNYIYITGQTIPVNGSIPLSQQIAFDLSWVGNESEVCMRVEPLNSTTHLSDPDTTNNEDCIHVHVVADVTGLGDISGKNTAIYPVPANDYFYLDLPESPQRILAFDTKGSTTTLLLNDGKVDCRHLENGFYLLRIETENELIFKRVVIAH